MASQELKHRAREQEGKETEQPNVIQTTTKVSDTDDAGKQKKTAPRGFSGYRSLALAVALPLALTLLDIYYFGSSTRYRTLHKPFYFPPLWALHLACVVAVSLSSLSAWLVWAERGFHRQPNALMLYLGQLVLGIGWYPVVFGAGAVRVGLVLCGALLGVTAGCAMMFRRMNQIAGDLVKLCLVWPVLLGVVNLRLLYH